MQSTIKSTLQRTSWAGSQYPYEHYPPTPHFLTTGDLSFCSLARVLKWMDSSDCSAKILFTEWTCCLHYGLGAPVFWPPFLIYWLPICMLSLLHAIKRLFSLAMLALQRLLIPETQWVHFQYEEGHSSDQERRVTLPSIFLCSYVARWPFTSYPCKWWM